MAIVTNTSETYNLKGIREDLSDVIALISPTDCPFSKACGTDKAANAYFEWQTDALAAADTTNAQIEGDDIVSVQTTTATVRVGNRCQISYKTLAVSGTADAVNKAGRKNETAYQIVKKTKELKRDMEAILMGNQTSVAGDATTARKTGSLRAWIASNSSLGATGANHGYSNSVVTAADDGTQRVLTEALLKSVIRQVYAAGGDPDTISVGPFNKQQVSAFTGNATRTIDAEEEALVASISVYKSDFGDLKVQPNRFQRERDAFVLQSDMWKIAWLRPLFNNPLAKTGDANKAQIIGEYGLMAMNEAASGVIADLTTS